MGGSTRQITVVLQGDASQFSDAMSGAVSDFEAAGGRIQATQDQIGQTGNVLSDVVGQFNQQLAIAAEQAGGSGAAFDLLGGFLGAVTDEGTGAQATMAGIGTALTDVGAVLSGLSDRANQALGDLGAGISSIGADIADYTGQLDAARDQAERFGESHAVANEALSQLIPAAGSVAAGINAMAIAENLAAARNIDLATAVNLVTDSLRGNALAQAQSGLHLVDYGDTAGKVTSATKAYASAQADVERATKSVDQATQRSSVSTGGAAASTAKAVETAGKRVQAAEELVAALRGDQARARSSAEQDAAAKIEAATGKVEASKRNLADVEERIRVKHQLDARDVRSMRDAQQALVDVQDKIAAGQLRGLDATNAMRDAQQRLTDLTEDQAAKQQGTAQDAKDVAAAQDKVTAAQDDRAEATAAATDTSERDRKQAEQMKQALQALADAHSAAADAAVSGGTRSATAGFAASNAQDRLTDALKKQADAKAALDDANAKDALNQAQKQNLTDPNAGAAEKAASGIRGTLHRLQAEIADWAAENGKTIGGVFQVAGTALNTAAAVSIIGVEKFTKPFATIGPKVKSYMGLAASSVSGFGSTLAALGPKAKTYVGLAGNSISGLVGSFASIGSKIGPGLVAAGGAIASFAGTVQAGFMTLIAPPTGVVLLVIAALALLAVAAYELYQHWDEIWPKIKAGLDWLYDHAVKPVVDGILRLWGYLVDGVKLYVGLWMMELDLVKAGAVLLWHGLEAIWGYISAGFSALWSGIKTVGGWIAAVWDDLVSGAGRVKDGVVGVFHGIVDAIKGVVNIGIGLIDFFIDKWNDIHFDVPEFNTHIPGVGKIGGGGFGLPHINPIPQLAQGGVVKKRPGGMLAVIGEGDYDEAVVPLKPGGPGMGGGGDTVVHFSGPVYADSRGIRALTEQVRAELIRQGGRGSTSFART